TRHVTAQEQHLEVAAAVGKEPLRVGLGGTGQLHELVGHDGESRLGEVEGGGDRSAAGLDARGAAAFPPRVPIGFHVLKVVPDSPAFRCGIEPYFDYIVEVNGIVLSSKPCLRYLRIQSTARLDAECDSASFQRRLAMSGMSSMYNPIVLLRRPDYGLRRIT
ncbi:hypothetical protein HK405_008605, partial [Cladochytrium tenue]